VEAPVRMYFPVVASHEQQSVRWKRHIGVAIGGTVGYITKSTMSVASKRMLDNVMDLETKNVR
jgi:hypothetical protein